MNDLKFAIRQWLKSPGFTAVAATTLALGIGANTAIFQLLNAVRLKTLPVAKPQDLVEVRITGGNPGLGIFDGDNAEMTYPLWEQIQKQHEPISPIFAWSSGELALGRDVETRMVRCLWTSGDFFQGLGLSPVRGRLFKVEDDRRGGGPGGVVISYAFWQSEFGGQDSILGQSLTLGDRVFQVVGVTPPGFFGLEVGKQFDVALPIFTRAFWWDNVLDRTDAWWLRVMGRLRPGSTLAHAAASMNVFSPGFMEATLPAGYRAGAVETYRKMRLSAFPAGIGVSQLRADYEKSLWLLLGITGLVLVIACVNLANLTMARASARMREMAVRLAVGASRLRLVRQLMTESLLLAGAGAVAGAALAHFLSRGVVWFLSTQGNRLTIDLDADWRVLGFTSIIAVLTCVFFGVAPAIRSARTAPVAAMNAGGRGLGGTRERFAVQRGLTVLQMAVSLVLLSGALLLVRSFLNLATLNPGFRQDGVFVTFVNFSQLKPSAEGRQAFRSELLERIRAVPGVESAAITTHVPVMSGSWTMGVHVTGAHGEKEGWSKVAWVSDDFFRTMRTPLLAGRDISAADTATSPKVMLVNEAFVRLWLGGANPMGAHVRTIAEPGYPQAIYQIVGIVQDAKYSDLRSDIPPTAYAPRTQLPKDDGWAMVVIRSSVPLPAVMAAVKESIATLGSSLRLGTGVLSTAISDGLARERLLAWLSGFFGILAILLVMVGLYGLVSYSTQLRRKELGLRVALGAQRLNILRLVLGQGLGLAVFGVGIGIGGALALSRLLGNLLFGLKPTDLATLAATSFLLFAVALFASWLPARRAAKTDPMEALRYE